MIRKNILLILLSFFSTYSVAECVLPTAPKHPDGAVSNMEEMVAGQRAVRAFQAEVREYRACLVGIEEAISDDIDTAEAAINAKFDEIGELAKEDGGDDALQSYQVLQDTYNAAVDKLKAVADEFNAEIREYKEIQANQ